MEKDIQPDIDGAEVKVNGYRFTFLSALCYFGLFFSGLIFFMVCQERTHVSKHGLIIAAIACGIAAVLFIALIVCDKRIERTICKRACVLLYKDGMTVYVTKPKEEKGYVHFKYDELEDYGFIHIVRGKESGESLSIFRTKHQSAETYLFCHLYNYGYMRISTKDGGYYNVPIGDIETVRNYLKEHAAVNEFIYQRIGGIHDDIIIPPQ